MKAFALCFAAGWGSLVLAGAQSPPFAIRVVDEQTGRGVPLVELKTVHEAAWWTDSAGLIAFHEPGLMDREVFFQVSSPGYEFPKDFFGNRGLRLTPKAGGRAEVKLRRLNIAERLYRVTGAGIYRDSVLLGSAAPLKEAVLNAQVLGQDTVIVTPYRGKLHWFWGDTTRASYPLGNFGASGATSELPGLDPNIGVDLAYFTDNAGFSKPMCPQPDKGLRWIEGVFTLPDETGRERLFARMTHVRDLGHVLGWYLLVFNDDKQEFEIVQTWDSHEGHDSAHPFRAGVGGVEYLYLYPNYRVRADFAAVREWRNYQAFTCLAEDGQVERDPTGRARYSWKAGAERMEAGRVREWIKQGKLKPEDSWLQLVDIETGAALSPGRGSVFWNEFLGRWLMLLSGKAGEVYFAEADTPTGPWVYARRVVEHGPYNFYNPTQHPFFDQEGGRVIYFEGTYTAAFSGARAKTPRYDYNQLMYRLALDDPRLALPAPVYRLALADGSTRYAMREAIVAAKAWSQVVDIAFFALPPGRTHDMRIALYANGERLQTTPPTPDSQALGHVLPATEEAPNTIMLDSTEPCRAWKNPLATLPLDFAAQPITSQK